MADKIEMEVELREPIFPGETVRPGDVKDQSMRETISLYILYHINYRLTRISPILGKLEVDFTTMPKNNGQRRAISLKTHPHKYRHGSI